MNSARSRDRMRPSVRVRAHAMSTLARVDLQDEVDQDTRAEILDNVRRLLILDTPVSSSVVPGAAVRPVPQRQ